MAADPRAIFQDFTTPYTDCWKQYVQGSGALEATGHTLLFINNRTSTRRYTNAQIDDYQGLPRGHFRWRPPLRMSVRARFSHDAGDLLGTAGFGFWNDPFLMTGRRMPTLPRVAWFFYASPPSNMKLDLQTPGYGWKAATLDAWQKTFLLLAPTAPLAVPLMNVRRLYHLLWPTAQRSMGVSEAALEIAMTDWHTYNIEWGVEHAIFSIDGGIVLESEHSPQGPLGLVLWLDNQYAVVTPWGRFGYGLLESQERQWMEVDSVSVEPG